MLKFPCKKQPPEVFYKKVFLKTSQISQTLLDFQLYQKGTPAQVFSCEVCETFKSTYFEKHLRTAASENVLMKLKKKDCS